MDISDVVLKCGYIPKEIKGKGSYGLVYSVGNENGDIFAFKYIRSGEIYKSYGIDSLVEIDILSRIHHPNIIQSLKILTSTDHQIDGLALILPLADRTLYDCLTDPMMTTLNKIPILFKIAKSLEFLHKNNILHLDIKMSNVVLQGNNPFLIDFGLSLIVDDAIIGRCLSNDRVTLDYRAPEILKGETIYNTKVDIWSLGILMLYFLSGKIIYQVDMNTITNKELYNVIVKRFSNQDIYKELLINVNNEYRSICQDLLSKILQVDPTKRISIEEICNHKLFDNYRTIINGTTIDQRINYDYASDQRSLIKLLIQWTSDIFGNNPVEILFLAIDLFNRVSSYYKNEEEIKRIHVVASCIWMSAKITEYQYMKLPIYIEKLTPLVKNIIDTIILQCEMEIISHLSGILYLSKLYKQARNTTDLKLSFDSIIMSQDSTLYARVDTERWENILKQNNNNPPNKNISIKDFLSIKQE